MTESEDASEKGDVEGSSLKGCEVVVVSLTNSCASVTGCLSEIGDSVETCVVTSDPCVVVLKKPLMIESTVVVGSSSSGCLKSLISVEGISDEDATYSVEEGSSVEDVASVAASVVLTSCVVGVSVVVVVVVVVVGARLVVVGNGSVKFVTIKSCNYD